MENEGEKQIIKQQIYISLIIAGFFGVASIIQCVFPSFQTIGSFILLFVLGSFIGLTHDSWPVLAAAYIIVQFIVSFVISFGLVKNMYLIDGSLPIKILKSPMTYILLVYIFLMYLLSINFIQGPLM